MDSGLGPITKEPSWSKEEPYSWKNADGFLFLFSPRFTLAHQPYIWISNWTKEQNIPSLFLKVWWVLGFSDHFRKNKQTDKQRATFSGMCWFLNLSTKFYGLSLCLSMAKLANTSGPFKLGKSGRIHRMSRLDCLGHLPHFTGVNIKAQQMSFLARPCTDLLDKAGLLHMSPNCLAHVDSVLLKANSNLVTYEQVHPGLWYIISWIKVLL